MINNNGFNNTPGDLPISLVDIQSISASKLLGRGSGSSGVPQEITLGANLSMSGTTLNASGGGGLSDGDYGDATVSGSGTAITIDNDVVTFAKMQNINTARILGRTTASSGDIEELSAGTGISIAGGTISSTITQYTDEQAQDTVATMIQNGTGITWSYNDGANTLTPTVTITQYTDEMAQDTVVTMIQNGTGISWSYNDAGNTLTPTVSLASFSTSNLSEGSNLYYTDERVDDRVSALIQNGTGISWSYNDAGGTFTPTVSLASFSTSNLAEGSNLYFTDERAQDAVGTILTDSSTIDFTYNDAGNSITAAVIANSSTQKVEVVKNSGAVVGTRKQLNFIEGSNVTLTVADDGANDQVDITIAASGGGGNTFSTIAVSGQSDVVADSSSDTLTLVAGSNITITTNATTDTVTIAASGGSGDVVGPGSATDNAIARYDSTTGKLIQNSYATIADDGSIVTSIDTGACAGGVSAWHWIMLTEDYTLANSGSAQKLFNTTTNGTLTLPTGVYTFQCFIYLTGMSATSGNATFSLAGTAVRDRYGYHITGIDNSSPLNAGARGGSASVTSASPASMVTAGTGTGLTAIVDGMFRVSTGGTIIPSVTLVTAVGTVAAKAGTWFRCAKIGDSSETYKGAWT